MKRGGKDGIATFSKKRVDAAEGWDGLATPTGFEIRNLGQSCRVVPEEGMLRLELRRVTEVGESVYHRVKVGDEWVADMVGPIFANSQVETVIPRVPGGWQLVAASGEFLEGGEPDREHRLLYFLKLE